MSIAQYFHAAKLELELIGVAVSGEFYHCPCGQQIKEHYYFRNKINGNTTYVSNVCVNNSVGIKIGHLFSGLKRVAAGSKANANEDLIKHAYKFDYIYETEYKFLMETRLRRKLSPVQASWKQKINRRILNKAVVQRRSKFLGWGLPFSQP